MLKLRNNPCTP